MPAPTPVPNDYTQPSLPTSNLRWPFCSVDLQILTKSDGWNQGSVERALEYSQISSLTGANYVALAVPYDNLTKYTNYVNDARTAGFKVYHRSHWNAWQGDNGVGNIATSTSLTRSGSTAICVTGTAHGLSTGDTVSMNGMNQTEYRGEFTVTVINSTTFTYPVSGSPASPATGNIGWRFGRQTYLDHTYDFIVNNPTLFHAGDMFAMCVEAQEADSQSMTFKTPGTTNFDYSLYNQFLKDQVRYANWAFQHIAGLEGKIHTWPISFGLSNMNLNGQTINVGGSVSTGNNNGLGNSDIVTYFAGRLTIDHYIDSSVSDASSYYTDYNHDIDAIAAAFPCVSQAGGGLMIGEWGFHTETDFGQQRQFDVYTQVCNVLKSKTYIKGVNFWNHLGQLQSSLWEDTSGTIVQGGRLAVGAVNTVFHIPLPPPPSPPPPGNRRAPLQIKLTMPLGLTSIKGYNLVWPKTHLGDGYSDGWTNRYDQTDMTNQLKLLQDAGIKYLRFWASIENYFNSDSATVGFTAYNATFLSNMDNFVNTVLPAVGMKAYFGITNAYGPFRATWTNANSQFRASYLNAYHTIIARYANNANIWAWDMANEPFPAAAGANDTDLNSFFQAVHDDGKATSPNHYFSGGSHNADAIYKPFCDFLDYHYYISDGSVLYVGQTEQPIIITECGFPDGNNVERADCIRNFFINAVRSKTVGVYPYQLIYATVDLNADNITYHPLNQVLNVIKAIKESYSNGVLTVEF